MKKFLLIAALCAFCMGAKAQEKMYEVKSGIITMEMDMMGRTVVQEIYFDDYGAKQATVMEFQGKRMRSLEVDGENLMIDDAENTAFKMPGMMMGGGSNEKINFLDKSDKNIRRNKIKELGTETLLGRECTKYTVSVYMMGQVMKQTVWVYKGITLKTSINTGFGEMVQQATNLVEDVEIPASTFEVPEGLEIKSMNRGGGPGGPMGGGPGGPMGGGAQMGGGGFPQF